MDFTELKASLKDLSPAYIIHGSDGFLRANALNQLKALVSLPENNITAFSDDSSSFRNALETYPMFSKYRLVIVNNPKKCVDAIIKYLDNPNASSILAVVYDESTPPAALIKKAQEVVCDNLQERYIITYIKEYAAKQNAVFSQPALAALIRYLNGSMAHIITETDKLIAYADAVKKEDDFCLITEHMVESLVEPLTEYKLYEFTEALGKRDINKAMAVYNKLLVNKAESGAVLSALYNHFRRLLHLSLHPEGELSGLLGIKPYAEKMMRRQCKNFSQLSLKRITDILSESEFLIKSGTAKFESMLNLAVLKTI